MNRLFLGLALLLLGCVARAQPVADYRFDNTLDDSLGAAPALTALQPADGSFITDTVGPDNRTVRLFSPGGGFQVSSAGLIDNTGYSVAILLRLDSTGSYAKILDTRARNDDAGLYAQNNRLRLYPLFSGNAPRLPPDEWHQVTVTRAANGDYVGYVDGFRQFSGNDGGVGEISAEALLSFVVDDAVTVGERSGGAIARIRLYDYVLSPDVVAVLDDNQVVLRDGFELLPN
ncbi:LamG-like jellyroll fold domain-containing protein [Chiayiivirga flava]|uniref:LamG domain-containing protein n=1 Tax=Chiayiivirga flava TaxID=659595 RepID=A0A7W8D463_9GAMM|nr:LamG-like jellyroll fold domain-containing protein [Chiayiivirga flava]MBB5207625.1 hypothetical protein [Chiayiivirga flava]